MYLYYANLWKMSPAALKIIEKHVNIAKKFQPTKLVDFSRSF